MLLRCFAVVSIFVLLAQTAFSQLKPLKLTPFQKTWQEGKLTWDDFQGKPLAVTLQSSELIYYFLYKPERIRTSDTTFLKIRAIAYMDRNQSWVHDTAKTETQLKANQLIFNTIELHRRLLENRFLRLKSNKEVPGAYEDEFRNLRELQSRIAVETKGGTDTAKLNTWLARTYRQIDSVKTDLPTFKIRNTGWGSSFGYSHAILNGKLSNTFTNFSGIASGFNFRYRDWFCLFNLDMGSGRTNAEFHGNYHWPSGLKVSMGHLSAALGYQVLNATHWRIVPYVGPAMVKITPEDFKTYENQSIKDYSLTYGVQLDWKFRNHVNFTQPGKQSFLDYGLRTRFSYNPIAFSPDLNGSVYQLSFALYFQGSGIIQKK